MGNHFDFQNGAWGVGLLMKWIQKHYNNPVMLLTENGLRTNYAGLEDNERIVLLKVSIGHFRSESAFR